MSHPLVSDSNHAIQTAETRSFLLWPLLKYFSAFKILSTVTSLQTKQTHLLLLLPFIYEDHIFQNVLSRSSIDHPPQRSFL